MAKKSRRTLSPKNFLEQAKVSKKKPNRLVRPKKAKFISKTYNISLSEFLHTVYVRNEQIPIGQRMNDPSIAAFVRKEFEYDEIRAKFEDLRGIRKVIYYRNMFNKGELLKKKTYPEFLSYRYDDGKMVTSDRSDLVFDDPEEWKTEKSAYYTAHMIYKNNGTIPLGLASFEWVLPCNHPQVVDGLRKLKNYSEAARERHVKRKLKK